MAVEKVRPIDRVLEIFYSFAAVPVLLGALFKLTHTTPFGSPNGWLYVGLGTEAVVFCTFGLLYWLAPPKAVDEMGVSVDSVAEKNNAPQKSSLVAIDDMLKQADITPDSLDRLSAGFKNLETSIQRISAATNNIADTEDYAKQLKEASASLANMNSFYGKLAETSSALANSADDAKRTQEQISALAQNLAKLNQVYANMLTAMNVKAS